MNMIYRLLAALFLLSAPAQAQQAHPATHHRRTAPQPAATATPMAYYCASGNVVKYHASPTCRASIAAPPP